MTKQDLPEAPGRPPAKRRILQDVQRTPDIWLAIWAAKTELTPSELRRVTEERHRRKQLAPDNAVGILIGNEGVTPGQLDRVLETVEASQPTEIHHAGVSHRLHGRLKRLAPVTIHHGDYALQSVVRASSMVVVAPRAADASSPVMEAGRYARHRNLRTILVLP